MARKIVTVDEITLALPSAVQSALSATLTATFNTAKTEAVNASTAAQTSATNAATSAASAAAPTDTMVASLINSASATRTAGDGRYGLLPGAWTTYAAALTATTTNPNIGTTGTIVGKYSKVGRTVHWKVLVQPSGTGITAGSGDYRVSMPFTPATAAYMITGYGWAYTAAGFRPLVCDGSPSRLITTSDGLFLTGANGLTVVGHVLAVSGTYESAS